MKNVYLIMSVLLVAVFCLSASAGTVYFSGQTVSGGSGIYIYVQNSTTRQWQHDNITILAENNANIALFINRVARATGTGRISFDVARISPQLSPGTYNITAEDISSGTVATTNLTVLSNLQQNTQPVLLPPAL